MDAFVAWLQATPLSQFIVFKTWIWPLCETVHFIGLALLIGLVGFFDLRLMGFFRSIPIAAARELMPFALFGFLLNLVTGITFLIGHPEQYVHNPAWWWKVVFLLIAGANAGVFEQTIARRIVSLVAWFGVLYWGRMLPFIGNAF